MSGDPPIVTVAPIGAKDKSMSTDTTDTAPLPTIETIVAFIEGADVATLDQVFGAIVRRSGKIARANGGYLAGRYFADPSMLIKINAFADPTAVSPAGSDKKAIVAAERATAAVHKAADALNKALDTGVSIAMIVGEAARETSAAATTVSGSREIRNVVAKAARRA